MHYIMTENHNDLDINHSIINYGATIIINICYGLLLEKTELGFLLVGFMFALELSPRYLFIVFLSVRKKGEKRNNEKFKY